MNVSRSADDAAMQCAQVADQQQAGVFHRLLRDRHAEVTNRIADHYGRLTRFQNRDEYARARAVRRALCEEQRELYAVQRMIDALDDRFPGLRSVSA